MCLSVNIHVFFPGNISPHHDELSSETPPSYNQLNYNDNLSRFFNSQPKTLTEKEVLDASSSGDGKEPMQVKKCYSIKK